MMYKVRILLGLVAGLLFSVAGIAQTSINFKAGVSCLVFKDEKKIDSELRHVAHHYGFDIFIERSRTYFKPGFHYQGIALQGESNAGSSLFRNRVNYHQVRIPLSFGFRISKTAALTSSVYAGGQMDFLLAVDDNQADLNSENMHDLQLGYHAGVQFGYRFLTCDVFFSKSLTQLVKTRDGSVGSGLGFSLGIML